MKRYNFTNPLFLLKIEAMIRRFYILFCLVFLVACDDGDILTVQLDFNQELERCDNFEDSYIIFDTKDDPSEALILIIPKNATSEEYFTNSTPRSELESNSVTSSFPINPSSGVQFIYRTYNRNISLNDICAILPPNNLSVVNEYIADSGTVEVTFTFIDDDNDGIPSEFEYGPGGIENPQDSDGDGIPDYIDEDDDNDNVPTRNELNNDDNDDDPFTNPLNTDADIELANGSEILPDYLDDDDDGDGILTRLEDMSEDGQNPRDSANEYTTVNGGEETYRYLSNEEGASEAFEDSGFIYNEYTRAAIIRFEIFDVNLEIINSTYIDLGTYENSFIITNEPEED